MLDKEQVHLMAALRRKGFSCREISRTTGYARRTVGKYLAAPENLPRSRTRVTGSTKLDPFKAHLEQRVRMPGWTAKGFFLELGRLGYEGGYSMLKRQFTRVCVLVLPSW